ncbi:MAG: uroporphyrinogen decarboxylase family protein [Promethearchaeota archaeon]
MNRKERVQRAFHFNRPDRVPMSPATLKSDFFPVMPNIPRSWQPPDYPPHIKGDLSKFGNYFYRKFYYNWNDENRKRLGLEKHWWQTIKEVINEWGIIWRTSGTKSKDKTFGHPYKGPFTDNWDTLNDWVPPDASDPERYRLIRTKLWKRLGKKRYTIGSIGVNGLFNLCTQLRGFNELLIDFAKNIDKVHLMIEKILPFYLKQVEKLKEFYPSLDSIMWADDLGTQRAPFMSPRIFNKFFKAPYKKVIDLTHDSGMNFILHSCGQILELMPDLVEAGVNVFEFDSPLMTGVENFKHYAEERKVAFWLSSNIQSTWIQDMPEAVEDQIRYYIKEVGNNEGGLAIYEYGGKAAIGVPKENVKAQREAVLKWGNYNKNGIIDWLA